MGTLQELGHNLSTKLDGLLLPIMSKLMTLHQLGMTASHPAVSCVEVLDFNPNTPSGYYWLEASDCLLYTSPSPRDATLSRMPSSA